ncbi:MAG: hypothetical protein QOI83_3959, partial [Streptomycetaceae bacterium]|nr:hypothetical protein [Streptomycetaceae bacterium]
PRPGQRPGGPHHTPGGPTAVLAQRGWHEESHGRYQYQHSPDRHAYLRLNLDLDEADFHSELEGGVNAGWTMFASVQEANGPRWHSSQSAPHSTWASTGVLPSRLGGRRPVRHLNT